MVKPNDGLDYYALKARVDTEYVYVTDSMTKAGIIFGIGALLLGVFVAYQIGACEVANLELREDLRDIAAQNAPRIGLTGPNSDEDIRNSVVRSARGHGIVLEPQQITVQRTGPVETPVFYLSVDYNVRVRLLVYTLVFHFTPTSER